MLREGRNPHEVTVRPERFVPRPGMLDSVELSGAEPASESFGRPRSRSVAWSSPEDLAEAFYENLDLRGAALGEDLSWTELRKADRRILVDVCRGLLDELGPEVEYVELPKLFQRGQPGETQCPACSGKGWLYRAFAQRVQDQVDLVRTRMKPKGNTAKFRSYERSFHRLLIQHVHVEWRENCLVIAQMAVYQLKGFDYEEVCAVLDAGRRATKVERFYTREQIRRKRAHKNARHLPKVSTTDWGIGCRVFIGDQVAESKNPLWSFSRNRYEAEMMLAETVPRETTKN